MCLCASASSLGGAGTGQLGWSSRDVGGEVGVRVVELVVRQVGERCTRTEVWVRRRRWSGSQAHVVAVHLQPTVTNVSQCGTSGKGRRQGVDSVISGEFC